MRSVMSWSNIGEHDVRPILNVASLSSIQSENV